MKSLISWFLKNIPRKYLQLFSHFGLRAIRVFYAGNNVECPVCGSTYSKFLPYGRVARPNALCPNCLALERHRLMWLFLKDRTDFFTDELKVLHIAPELCFIDRFKAMDHLDYVTADIESPLADVKMDIHDIPFEENTFDVVFCNHVLEHVDNDIRAMQEMHRVLKPGGWGIMQIPLFHPLAETTVEDPSITDPAERERRFGQDDHVRMYGKDYPDRLRSAGFSVDANMYADEIDPNLKKRYALPNEEPVFYVSKSIEHRA